MTVQHTLSLIIAMLFTASRARHSQVLSTRRGSVNKIQKNKYCPSAVFPCQLTTTVMQCCKQTRLKHEYQLLHRSCATSHSKLFRNAQQSQKLPSPDLIGYRRIICRVFIITLRRFTFTFAQIEKPNFFP